MIDDGLDLYGGLYSSVKREADRSRLDEGHRGLWACAPTCSVMQKMEVYLRGMGTAGSRQSRVTWRGLHSNSSSTW